MEPLQNFGATIPLNSRSYHPCQSSTAWLDHDYCAIHELYIMTFPWINYKWKLPGSEQMDCNVSK